MLKSKSILAPKEETDGTRISIMSRHTLNDGKTPDPRLTSDLYDEHMKEFAVPPKVIGAYRRKEIPFEQLASEYVTYITTQREKVIALIQRALHENITVLCMEGTEEKHLCHRSLFMQYSKELADALQLPLEIEVQ